MKRIIVNSSLALVFTVGAAGLATAATAGGQVQSSGQTVATLNAEPSSRIETQFSDFAGSSANAQSLVEGLRTGSEVTLTGADNSTTSFAVPGGTSGYGEVAISLGLAQQSLASYGISDPTPQQIQAALVGGTVTTADGTQARLAGVLTLRNSGMGWGKIAQTYDVKLGTVVSDIHSAHGQVEAAEVDNNRPESAESGENGESSEAAESGQTNAHASASVAANARADENEHGQGAAEHAQVADAAHGQAQVNIGKPDVQRPEVEKPDVERPHIQKPEIERPHIQKPDIERPDVARPNQ